MAIVENVSVRKSCPSQENITGKFNEASHCHSYYPLPTKIQMGTGNQHHGPTKASAEVPPNKLRRSGVT